MANPIKATDKVSEVTISRRLGVTETVGNTSVTIETVDTANNVRECTGTSVPSGTGYATGCDFINTAGGSGTTHYINIGTSSSANFVAVPSGGGGGSGSLDDSYNAGSTITMDSGAITLNDATTGANNDITITKTGAGSGNLVDLNLNAAVTGSAIDLDMDQGLAAKGIYIDCGAGARTGKDVDVKDDSTGTHSVFNIEKTGSGASTGFDWQDSAAGSTASFGVKLTFDNAAGLDSTAIQVVRGSGIRSVPVLDINDASTGTADLIDIDLTGVFTGDVMSFTSSAAATGNVWSAVMDNAVAMTALSISGAGVRTQPFIELIGTQTGSANMIDLSADGAFTGNVVDLDLNAAVGGKGIGFTTAGARTEAMLLSTFAGTAGGAAGGTMWDINVTQTGAGANPLFDIDVSAIYTGDIFNVALSAASTGHVLNIDMDAAVAASAIILDYGNGVRTEDMCQVTFDGSGTNPFWDINITNTGAGGTSDYWDVDVTGVYTASVLDIAYGAVAATGDAITIAMGSTAVDAKVMSWSAGGSRVDDLCEINDSSTTNSHVFDINKSGIGSGNVLDITYSAADTGDAISVVMADNVAGSVLVATGTGVRTDDFYKIDSDDTGAAHVWDVNLSGAGSGNGLDITYSVGAHTGNAVSLAMGTNVEGQALLVTSAATGVSGEGSALDITHTGNLVAGANLVDIISTGSPSSTSHVMSLQQTTGAGNAGAYVLYINATGASVEGLKVDAGAVVFDETLLVTGAATFTAGAQSASVAVTATADGLTTGLIPSGTRYVTAASGGNANNIITLPAAVVGNIITVYVGADGCEVRTPSGSNVTINNVDSDGTNEAALPATTLATFTCTTTTSWILEAVDELGAVITAIVPDAA